MVSSSTPRSDDGRVDSGGACVVVISEVIPVAPGYLALRAEEKVLVEYRGCDTNGDQGWCFGCSLASGQRGWFAEVAVSEELGRESFGTSLGAGVGCEREVSTDVPALGPGYVALARGETVKVTYMGAEASNDDGWLFGVVVATGQEGWFSAVAISKSMATLSDTRKGSDTDIPSRSCPAPGKTEAMVTCPEPVCAVITPSRCPSSTSRAAAIAAQDGLTLLGSRAPEALPWQYPLCDSERSCFVGLLPGALDQKQARKMYHLVYDGMEEVEWEAPIRTMNGKVWVCGPRQTRWFVVPGCRCPYAYGGPNYGDGHSIETIVKPVDFPRWMREVMKVVMPLCGLTDAESWPNCCSMNRYSPKAECDWHADDGEIFQGSKNNCSIISLSLGAKRVFEVRRAGEHNTACKFDLNGGDLCTMEGMTQKYYQHAVFQQPGARLNLTWRWITAHNAQYCAHR